METRRKTRSRKSVMRKIRPGATKRKRSSSSVSNTSNSERVEQVQKVKRFLDSYTIIHTKSLIILLEHFKCSQCNSLWKGSPIMRERNGLYVQFEFVCFYCEAPTRLFSSATLPNSKRHDINVILALGGTLCGLVKLVGALNLSPPIQEQSYRATQEFIVSFAVKAKYNSMTAAIETAVQENGRVRNLTVSSDGTWLTRGHSNVHGVAALCTATKQSKVIDTS
ncbi:unnamed protein product [Adineta ricciae]|uniref:Mutator-like transposase domain-containing protein n=1 Tax=Adineta ricciae TaxID=249248 RepID=A0A814MNE0_ADIRI|nr:unnamed protein product [Adineta ricciae]CAF1080272.1 unnamed protein product [Adineta ricciae]